MARFAVPTAPVPPPVAKPWSLGPTVTPAPTFEGGAGFTGGDPRAELFNAVVSGLLADGFYETAGEALTRVRRLVGEACQADPAWVRSLASWARSEAHLRSAPVVIAAEYAALGLEGSRQLVDAVCQRADEPGEVLAYWHAYHGRKVPSRVKRGLADACRRLYTERSAARYDGQGKTYRFGDVLELVHPKPTDARQSALFKHLLDRRRHPQEQAPEQLAATRELRRFMDATPELRASWRDAADGPLVNVLPSALSWEALAAVTPGGLDKAWWSALVMGGHLGGMALIRNLNNMDRAGVDDPAVIAEVRHRLSDPLHVERARMLPYRYLTAYVNTETDRWKEALAAGADAALANLPRLPGNTIIMVDCSGSMSNPVGAGKSRQPLKLSQLAGLVAESLARRCDAALILPYGDHCHEPHEPKAHVPVLKAAASPVYNPSGGTSTWRCATTAFKTVLAGQRAQGSVASGVDRMIVLTDEQTSDRDSGEITCPVVTWNLAGTSRHQARHGSRNRYLVSGYSDTALETLPAIVLHGSTGVWPWEVLS